MLCRMEAIVDRIWIALAVAFFVSSIGLGIATRKTRRPLTDAMIAGYFLMGVGAGFHAWRKTEMISTVVYAAGACCILYGIYRHYRDQRKLAPKTKTE